MRRLQGAGFSLLTAATLLLASGLSANAQSGDFRVVVGTVYEFSATTSVGPRHDYSVALAENTRTHEQKILLSVKSENRTAWTRKLVSLSEFSAFAEAGRIQYKSLGNWLGSLFGSLSNAIRRVADFIDRIATIENAIKEYVVNFLKKIRSTLDDIIREVEGAQGTATAAQAAVKMADAARIGSQNGWMLTRRIAKGFGDMAQSNPRAAWALSSKIVQLP